MNQVQSTIASLVLTVLLTVGCTHVLFSDKGFLPWRNADEPAFAGIRRSQLITTPEPDAEPVDDANPAASEWVSVPIFTTPAPPTGPAPAPHTLPAFTNHTNHTGHTGHTSHTNHSYAELGLGRGAV